MKPGVVRQLTPQEAELLAAKAGLEVPEGALLLGYEYTDETTAHRYISRNRQHGNTVAGPMAGTAPGRGPVSLVVVEVSKGDGQ